MKTIKRIDPMSAAKVSAAVGIIMGLVLAVMSLLFSGFAQMQGMMGMVGTPFATATGIFAIVALPIAYAVVGFVSGFVWSVIYNFVADKIGGVKVDLK